MGKVSSSNSQGVRVPKLRFPGFEGEWNEKSLSDVATGFDYGMNAAAGAFDGLNKYIRITDIDEESRCYIDENPVSPKGELDDKYLVLENDILFARTGASTGKTYLYKRSDGKLYFAGFLIRISVNCDNNSTFVYNATLTDRYNRWVRLTSMRSGQPGINSQEYSSYKTYYPLLPEQDKIASFLKKLDQRIEKQRQLVEALKSYKRGALSKLFPKKGETTPEYRFAGFTEPWEQQKWCETVDMSKEMVDPRNGTYNNLPHVAPGNIESFTGRLFDNVKTVEQEELISGKFHFHAGDIIYCKINPQLGKYYFAQFEGLTSADAYVLKAKNGVIQDFLFAVLQTKDFFDYSVSVSKRSGMPKINREELNAYLFLAPSELEQEQIGAFLMHLDHLISAQRSRIDEYERMKAGLLQQLFI